jgi:hypothetical protein
MQEHLVVNLKIDLMGANIYQGSWFPNLFYYICNNYEMSLEDIFVEFVC